ncbi:MAG: c-type cytochrome [Pirellulaceae bacterium]
MKGAILFAQPSLGCASCHASGSDNAVGPDLSLLPRDRSDESLVQSLLYPSREIERGFETTIIETFDGGSLSLRVLERTAERITGREIVAPFRQVVVEMADVESIQKSRTSSMPGSLPDQLKDRQEFLDVVRYLMELRDAQHDESIARPTTEQRELDPRVRGLVLLDRLNCRACHAVESWDLASALVVTPYQPPRLERVGSRIDPEYLERFLLHPAEVKPGTTMPALLGELPPDEQPQAARELAHYLRSLDEEPFERTGLDGEQVIRGQELFHEVGCVACHAPRDDQGRELPLADSAPLGSLGVKYSVESLAAFLEQPHEVRPAGRMPDLQLDHFEALAIAHYLAQDQPAEVGENRPIDRELAERGRGRFQMLGCADCHGLVESLRTEPIVIAATNRGCLGDATGPWPHYAMTDDERELLTQVLTAPTEDLTSARSVVEFGMASLDCFACHARDGLGGVSLERDSYFQTADFNLGPQGRMPPNLSAVGNKRPEWLRQVLVSGRSIRPYMKTRMPRFGAHNVEALANLMTTVDDLPDREYAEPADRQETRKVGHELAGNTGLNCIACHTFQLNPSETMSAVDLTEMAERLQPRLVRGLFAQSPAA